MGAHVPQPTAFLTLAGAGSAPSRDAALATTLARGSDDEPSPGETRAAAAGMRLLAAGVPLTLLLDLCLPVDSSAIAAAEGGSASWLEV
jgi:hypothetical protein